MFPGGGVDDDDRAAEARTRVPSARVPELSDDAAAAFLHAGLREAVEEVGLWVGGDLPVDASRFPHVGHWITPEDAPRRYDTHFFLARYIGGTAAADQIELTDVWWERPESALERIDTGDLDAILPTIEFLRSLSKYRNVSDAFAGTGCGLRHHHLNGWTSF